MTFRQMLAVIEGVAARLAREHDERAWAAWHIAALTRTKKFPELKKMISGSAGAKPRQDWKSQEAILSGW